ncbi:MAG: DUF1893 domain-containing protein [Spirochaetales bacterium]|nr:DUF1893 domain-containing protein [Spirochaetales bacterium]
MNLKVYKGEELVFSHDGHWLHPLFALEDFLSGSELDAHDLTLEDKLIGRGAAVLISRMGFRSCYGKTVSQRGLSWFEQKSVDCGYGKLVEKLDCQTELILTDDMTEEDAYAELARRAGRA